MIQHDTNMVPGRVPGTSFGGNRPGDRFLACLLDSCWRPFRIQKALKQELDFKQTFHNNLNSDFWTSEYLWPRFGLEFGASFK